MELEASGKLADVRAELHFVGDGRMRGNLEARARELGIGERVTFHGPVVDAGRFLAAFDLLALSSRTEGTPMVLFEALAAGVPIVATTVGGVPDVVSEREALLVPSEDPGALATAIERALGFPEEARERADRAAHRLRSAYAVEPWLDAHVSLYRGLLGFPAKREGSSA